MTETYWDFLVDRGFTHCTKGPETPIEICLTLLLLELVATPPAAGSFFFTVGSVVSPQAMSLALRELRLSKQPQAGLLLAHLGLVHVQL